MTTDGSAERQRIPDLGLPPERRLYARAVGIEAVKVGWFLVLTALVGVALDPLVPWARIHPSPVFGDSRVLGVLGVTGLAVALKPISYDRARLNRFYSPGLVARTTVLYTAFVAFLVFALGVFGGRPGIGRLPEVLGTLFAADLESLGLGPLLAFAVLLAAVILFFSHATLLGMVGGGIVGGVAGLVGWNLSLDALLAGLLAGGLVGALVGSALLGLDSRQVDDGAIAATVVVAVGLLLLAPDPALVLGWSACAGGAASGIHLRGTSPARPTNALVAMSEDGSVGRISGFEDLHADSVEPVPPASVALLLGLQFPLRGGWGVLVNLAVVVLLSPVLLFLPLFLCVGYLCRVLAAAGHGYDGPPAVRVGLGRRALFKEGALGVVAVGPLLLFVGALLPPVLGALPVVRVGDGTVALADFGALLTNLYQAVGLPAPLVGSPVLAALGLLAATAAIPVVATNYAMTGRLRAAYDPRRKATLVWDRRFLPYLGLQAAYLVAVRVGVSLAGAIGLFVATVAAAIAGVLGGLVGLLVVLGWVAGLMLLPAGSAALWGIYARGRF